MNTTTSQTHIGNAPDATKIMCDFMAFRLDECEFAVALDNVCELRRFGEVAPRHAASGDVVGTLARHDGDIEVFDLHAILDLPSMRASKGFDVVVIRASGRITAVAVDEVSDVITLPVDEFLLVTGPASERNHIWAVATHGERVLRLLDPESLATPNLHGRIARPRALEQLAA